MPIDPTLSLVVNASCAIKCSSRKQKMASSGFDLDCDEEFNFSFDEFKLKNIKGFNKQKPLKKFGI